MKEKTFKKVRPCGKLIVGHLEKEYWLLHPYPVPKDSWQSDTQQTWYVVSNDPFGWNKDQTCQLYPMSRHVTVPIGVSIIEVYDSPRTILVWDGDEVDPNEASDDYTE